MKRILVVLLLVVAGCSAGEKPAPIDTCAQPNADLRSIDAELKTLKGSATERDMRARVALRIIVNHPTCYTPEQVAEAQEALSRPPENGVAF